MTGMTRAEAQMRIAGTRCHLCGAAMSIEIVASQNPRGDEFVVAVCPNDDRPRGSDRAARNLSAERGLDPDHDYGTLGFLTEG